jgi:MFS family permease
VAVAFLLFAIPGTEGSFWTTFFPAAIVLGIGMAITVPPLTTAVMSAVPQHQAGTASGINNAVARTAGLIAIAVFGVIVTTVFNRELTSRLDAMPTLPAAPRGGRGMAAGPRDEGEAKPRGGAGRPLSEICRCCADQGCGCILLNTRRAIPLGGQ